MPQNTVILQHLIRSNLMRDNIGRIKKNNETTRQEIREERVPIYQAEDMTPLVGVGIALVIVVFMLLWHSRMKP